MDPFLGQIIMFGGNFAPRGWAFCDGQLLAINSNTALFSILGTTYGGDGRTTFGLPDLRSRVAIGQGTGPGLPTYQLGAKGGDFQINLNVQHLPSHEHTATFKVTKEPVVTTKVYAHSGEGDTNNASDAYFATGGIDTGGRSLTKVKKGYSTNKDTTMKSDAVEVIVSKTEGTVDVSSTGSGQAFNNMQPYSVVNYIIALQGIFPSRS